MTKFPKSRSKYWDGARFRSQCKQLTLKNIRSDFLKKLSGKSVEFKVFSVLWRIKWLFSVCLRPWPWIKALYLVWVGAKIRRKWGDKGSGAWIDLPFHRTPGPQIGPNPRHPCKSVVFSLLIVFLASYLWPLISIWHKLSHSYLAKCAVFATPVSKNQNSAPPAAVSLTVF